MKIGAYYYPQTTSSSERRRLPYYKNKIKLISEYKLAQSAPSLFSKHSPKKEYGIQLKDVLHSDFDDCSKESIKVQIDYCVKNRLNHLIFDSYVGLINGNNATHLTTPFHNATEYIERNNINLFYANLFCLRGSRVQIPLKSLSNSINRAFDLSEGTALTILKYLGKYVKKPNYLRIDGRPYVTIMIPANESWSTSSFRIKLNRFMSFIKNNQVSILGQKAFLVGIFYDNNSAEILLEVGFDAIAQYAEIPDFKNMKIKKTQDYLIQSESNINSVTAILNNLDPILIPSISIGWDASVRVRLENKFNIKSLEYPAIPIIENNTPENFQNYLKRILKLLNEYPQNHKSILNVFAFNEVGESASLLPYKINDTYLNPYMEILNKIITI